MDLNWEKFRKKVEKVSEYAEERFPEDEFYIDITIWTTTNQKIQAIHGIKDTPKEEAFLIDTEGNIIFEERKRKGGSRRKEILESEMIESPEGLSIEEWKKMRMQGEHL
jgi:hypothetical protein